MSATNCILVISIIMVIIITIMVFIDKSSLIKASYEKRKLFKAQKIVNSILDDYSKDSNLQLDKTKTDNLHSKNLHFKYELNKQTDNLQSKYELIISRCELLKKLPPTFENYIMIYNGLLNYSKKNDNSKIHKLGVLLDVE